jgi:hypothetical protein
MEPLSIAALGLSAFGSLSKYYGSQEQAGRLRSQTEEQIRRMRLGQEQQLGQAAAAGAGSGVEFESASLQQHLGAMQAEFTRQRDWLAKTGGQQASDISSAGELGLIGDLGGSLFSFGQANNWWRKPQGQGAP